jgi:hypothetical protein
VSANERGTGGALWATARRAAVPLIPLLLVAAALVLLLDSGTVHLPSVAEGPGFRSASPPNARLVVPAPTPKGEVTPHQPVTPQISSSTAPVAGSSPQVVGRATTSPAVISAGGSPTRSSAPSTSPSNGEGTGAGVTTTTPTSPPPTTTPEPPPDTGQTAPVTPVSPPGHVHGHRNHVVSGPSCSAKTAFPPGLALGRRNHTPPGSALGHRTHFAPGQACKERPHVPSGRAHQDNSSADDDRTDQGQEHARTSHGQHYVRERQQDTSAHHSHRGERHDNSGNGHEREHVHTSHSHHYGHEQHQESSAQHARQDEAPGNSEFGHIHGHGHVDEQDIPPGQAHGTQENGSHGRGHDH